MFRTAALVLLAASCGTAARAAEPMAMDHGAAMHAARPATARTAADRAFGAANAAMMKGMDVKRSGDPDRDFVAMMLPHHRGAVDMARVELRHGRDPALRRLAAAIVRAQAAEIAEMRDWQKRHVR